MEEQVFDVIVVGAGIAGLRSGVLLKRRGIKVLVLEANDRVGGRTKGKIVNGLQIDVGGQWIGPTQNRMYSIVEEYKLTTHPQYETGKPYQFMSNILAFNRTKQIPGITPLIQIPLLALSVAYLDYLAYQVPIEKPWEAKRAQEWDSYSVETWMRSSWWAPTNQVKSVVEIACWALLACEPSRVSFLWFLWFIHQAGGLQILLDTKNGAQQDKIDGGAISVSQKMAEELNDNLELSSPVKSIINYHSDRILVQLDNGREYLCNRVIIACSPTMAARIHYNPPLPGCRDAFTQGYSMGHVIKTVAFYKTPFWRERKLSGEGVSNSNTVRLTFDASFPEHGLYGLVGFFLGDSALEWANATEQQRKTLVTNYYTTIFGDVAAEPVDYIENNWVNEEYIRGAYMAIPAPSILTRLGPALRTPIGNIHFAGTETALQWSGYMEGALESAERVVDELNLYEHDPEAPFPNLFNSSRKTRWQITDYSAGNFSLFKISLRVLLSAALFFYLKNKIQKNI